MALTKATNRMIDGAPKNVLDFGASPSNSAAANDTAFAAALSALSSGGKLVIPSGSYSLSATLNIPSACTIQGDGRTNTRLNFSGCSGLKSAANNQHVRIDGLYIVGDNTASTYGIEAVNNPRGFIIRDCYIYKFGTAGTGAGIFLRNDITYDMWGALVEETIVEECGKGYLLNSSNACTLMNCISRLNLGHSLEANGCTAFNVSGGLYENPLAGATSTQYNMYIESSQQFTISGVWSENAKSNNLTIISSQSGLISGCLFDNVQSTNPLVRIENSENINFVGVEVENIESGQIGVDVDAFCVQIDTSGIYAGGVNLGTLVTNDSLSIEPASTTVANGFTLDPRQKPGRKLYAINAASAIASNASTAIQNGTDGQVITLINTGSNSITLKNSANTALVGGVDYVIGQNDTLVLLYSTTTGLWHELSRSAT